LVAAVDGYSFAEEHAFMLRWFEPVAGTIVDAACGGGDHGRLVAQRHGPDRVVGVDLDPLAIERATHHGANPGIRYVLGDISDLPFEDARVGGIVCFGGLSLVSDPVRVIAEFARCTAPGAPLIGLVPRATGSRLQRRMCKLLGHNVIDPQQLRQWLQDAGWRPIDVRGRGWTTLFAARRNQG